MQRGGAARSLSSARLLLWRQTGLLSDTVDASGTQERYGELERTWLWSCLWLCCGTVGFRCWLVLLIHQCCFSLSSICSVLFCLWPTKGYKEHCLKVKQYQWQDQDLTWHTWRIHNTIKTDYKKYFISVCVSCLSITQSFCWWWHPESGQSKRFWHSLISVLFLA